MDHDRLFKELLTTFFAEFLELFLPAVAAELDRDTIHFMDKEIFNDIASKERHEVDLLAKVRLAGHEAYILIHVENQSTAHADFPERMFQYYALIRGKYRLPTYPIALFSYERPLLPAPCEYATDLFGLEVLRFRFHAIQLNSLNWRQFLGRPNPVASALMVKMRIAPEDRPRVTVECLRMIITLKLDPARSELIGTFMNSYLRLTAAEMLEYNREVGSLSPLEKESVMQLSNQWTDIGIEIGIERGRAEGHVKGRVEGRVEGHVEGRASMAIRQLRRRFGEFPNELAEVISGLNSDQLDDFGDALLDFTSVADAREWIARH